MQNLERKLCKKLLEISNGLIYICAMQTEIKKDGRGGPRKGSGAKPKKDKKEPLFLYVRQSIIKGNGGRNKARIKAETFLEQSV